MTESEAIVYVIDDDAQTRDALKNLMRSVGLQVEVFASAQDFLRSKRPDVPACLVLDVRLRGLRLQPPIAICGRWLSSRNFAKTCFTA
jgi:FixJ family two-component response regulator